MCLCVCICVCVCVCVWLPAGLGRDITRPGALEGLTGRCDCGSSSSTHTHTHTFSGVKGCRGLMAAQRIMHTHTHTHTRTRAPSPAHCQSVSFSADRLSYYLYRKVQITHLRSAARDQIIYLTQTGHISGPARYTTKRRWHGLIWYACCVPVSPRVCVCGTRAISLECIPATQCILLCLASSVCVCVCVCARVRVCADVCVFAFIFVCLCVCVCVISPFVLLLSTAGSLYDRTLPRQARLCETIL